MSADFPSKRDQIRDAAVSAMPSISEEAMAEWVRRRGTRTVLHQGRWWSDSIRGFYQPVSPLARFNREEATSPAGFSFGYRAALREDHADAATGTIPVHLFKNLAEFGLESLNVKRRSDVRKCSKLVEFVELTGPQLLREQGRAVVLSSVARTGYARPPMEAEYASGLDAYFVRGKMLALGGLIDGRLGGYMTGHAVDGTAYIDHVFIATDALRTSIGSGLLFEFLQSCRRAGSIREVSYGQETPENPTLGEFKTAFGFPVTHVPTKVSMNPLAGGLIRRLFPEKYYRLTGHR